MVLFEVRKLAVFQTATDTLCVGGVLLRNRMVRWLTPLILLSICSLAASATFGAETPQATPAAPAAPPAAAPPAQSAAAVVGLREVLSQWVQAQKALAQEKKNAKDASMLLKARIELVTKEIEDIEAKMVENQAKVTEADKKRTELLAQSEAITKSMDDLRKAAPGIELQLRELGNALPQPIKDKLAPMFERMDAGAKNDKTSLAERCQNIVAVLNEVNKSNGEVRVEKEVRAMADGSRQEVTSLYVGLAQAYFLSTNGKMAGSGKPGAQGWVWTEDNSLKPKVKLAIDMLQSKAAADFISFPAQLPKSLQ